MKRFILILMVIILTLSFSFNAIAENEEVKSEAKQETEQSKQEEIPEPVYIPHGKYILVCDAQNGYKIYSKGSNKTINPYGFTKILTAITVIENCKDINKEVTIPKDILKDYDYSNGNIGLASGEKISIKNLIYAMMLQDAGDCAIALAHVTAKSYDQFIKLINETAIKAGAEKSVFTDPAGFSGSTQKTTLEDMQKITTYALKNEVFCEIAATSQHSIAPNNKRNYNKNLFSKNKFMSRFYSEDYVNSNIKGVKEYYFDNSNTGLISRYSKGGDDLLILIAHSDRDEEKDYVYDDTLKLIEQYSGFFESQRYIKKEEFVSEMPVDNAKNTNRVLVVAMNDIYIRIPKEYDANLITREIIINKDIKAPLDKFEELGEIKIYYDNTIVGSAQIASYHKVEKSITKTLKNYIVKIFSSFVFWIIIVLSVLIITSIKNIKRKKKNKK